MKKVVLLAFVLTLLSSLLYIGLSSVVVEATNSYQVWNKDTDLYYATIQEAINANETLDGHELYLELDVFWEHVIINKSVALFGAINLGLPSPPYPYMTSINGSGTGTVITIQADNVTLFFINITNGINGVCLEEADNSLLWGLHVVDNAENGICLHNSRNCTLRYNKIVNNLYGIYIQNSSNNTVHHTNFINNTYQVCIETIDGYPSNTWDDGIEGNYWSDYEKRYPNATEIDGTDVWDTPYEIDESNIDRYPIVPEFPSFLILPLFMIETLLATVAFRRKIVREG